MFRLRSVLDCTSGLILKIRLNACRHLKNVCKLGLRPEFDLRTKSDLFYQVIPCFIELFDWACADNSFIVGVWLLQPRGSIFFTTINRTLCSYALAIVLAEYLVGLVPRGVHDWNKFIQPEELQRLITQSMCWTFSICLTIFGVCISLYWQTVPFCRVLQKNCKIGSENQLELTMLCLVDGFSTRLIHGTTVNPATLNWSWISNTSVCYALHAVKLTDHSTDLWTDSCRADDSCSSFMMSSVCLRIQLCRRQHCSLKLPYTHQL